jgi:hypothetical protein
MASDSVYDAIRAYMNTSWTATPVRWENERFTPPLEGGWVGVETTGTLYAQQSIGESNQADNRWDEEGVLWLHVFVPIGTGASLARGYAKQLADKFRGLLLLNDSLEFRDSFIGRGGAHNATQNETGSWYRVTVYIKWRRMDA